MSTGQRLLSYTRPGIRAFGCAFLAVTLSTCSDAPTAPNHPGFGYLAVQTNFSASALAGFNLTLDNVRLIVVRAPADTLANALHPFPPTQSQLSIAATLLLRQAAETLGVTLDYLSGSTLLFTQSQNLEIREGPPGTNPPPTLPPPVYVGPGASIATLQLAPRDTTLSAGAAFPFRVTALDGQAQPVTAFYVAWSSSGAQSPVDGDGTLHAQTTRAVFYVKVKTPTGVVDSTSVTVTLPPFVLIKLSGDQQPAAPTGSALPLPLVVQVQATDGLGVAGVPVTFTASIGGGSVAPGSAVTDTAGKAQTIATLGPNAGLNSYGAVASVGQVTFNEAGTGVVGPATQLFLATQPSATAASGVAFPQQPIIQLRDANNADVSQAGIGVTAAIASGGGTLGGTVTVTTNVSGQAVFTNLAITGTVGPRTLSFSATGLTGTTSNPITLGAGPAAAIAVQAGNNQSAVVNTAVTIPPAVIVTDASGNPVSGVNVTFAVASGGGTVVPVTPVATNGSGIAAVTSWTLGPTVGSNNNTLSATASGAGITGNPVSFTASGTGAPLTLTWTGATSTDWNTASNWNPAQVPTAANNVVIVLVTNEPISNSATDSALDVTVNTGANLALNTGSVLHVRGNIASAGTIFGNGTLQPEGTGKTLSGNIGFTHIVGSYALGGRTVANNSLDVVGASASLTLGGHTLVVTGAFNIGVNPSAQPGLLVMTNPLDSMLATGAIGVQFVGSDETGHLTAGVLVVTGPFLQGGSVSTASFAASGTHKTVFLGSQTVTMANPGPSHFQDIDVSPVGSVGTIGFVPSGLATGRLISLPSGPSPIIGGSLTAAGANVSGLQVFGTLVLDGGTITEFDNVSFPFNTATGTALTVRNNGTAAPLTFNNLSFGNVPTSGFYLSANDLDGATSGVLTINMVNPTPATPSTFVQTVNGAVVNWPFAPLPTWTGAISTDWSTAGNWSTGVVPTISDSVLIPTAARQPSLTTTVAVGAVNVTGGNLTLNGHGLTTLRSFATSGGGVLTMQNPADLLVVVDASFDGGDETGRLSAGTLQVAGNFTAGKTNSTHSFTAAGGTQTVTLVGTSVQAVSFADSVGMSFANLTVTNTTGVTLASTANVAGNLSLAAGAQVTGLDLTINGTPFVVTGNVSTASGSKLKVGRLYVSGTVNFASGSYAVTSIIYSGTGQTAPSNLPYQYVYISGTVTFAPGTVTIGTQLAVPSNSLTLGDTTVVVGAAFASGGQLRLNGHPMSVVGDFFTQGTGTVSMTSPSDLLAITGNASFSGGDESGLMTDGLQTVGGNFTADTVGGHVHTFLASGNHFLILNGAGSQTVLFVDPQSSFREFTIAKSGGGVDFPKPTAISGDMAVTSATTVTGAGSIKVSGNLITVSGSTISPAVFVIGGTLGALGLFQPAEVDFLSAAPQTIPQSSANIVYQTIVVESPATLGGSVSTSADLVIGLGGTLSLANNPLSVGGNFSTVTGGILTMASGDQVTVTGNATFSGGDETGQLTDGFLTILGNFSQSGGRSFVASGNHQTNLDGTNQSVTFADPTLSHFQNLSWNDIGGTLTLGGNVVVAGNYNSPDGNASMTGNGHSFTAALFNSSGLTIDDMPIIIDDPAGTSSGVNNLTFTNMPTSATQITIIHPGAPNGIFLGSIVFSPLAAGNTGFYIDATDSDGPSPFVLTMQVSHDPGNGPAFTKTNGATVNWAP